MDPVAVASIAVVGSILAGNIWLPPQPGQMQRPASGRPIGYGFLFPPTLLAMIASQCIASSKPPPSAAPKMRAIVG